MKCVNDLAVSHVAAVGGFNHVMQLQLTVNMWS